MIRNPWALQEAFRSKDVDLFAREVLGLDPHEGQMVWLNKSWKLINVLDPSNQWGKTLAEAIKHIYHCVTKPRLLNRVTNPDAWQSITYRTLNVGKTYEVARGVHEAIVDIVNGGVLLPDGSTNKSLLKGWAIKKVEDVQNKPPRIIWWNHSEMLTIS